MDAIPAEVTQSTRDLEREVVAARVAHLTETDVRLARAWLGVRRDQIQGPPVGLLVGEMPGPNTHARLPMFPFPASSAGGRLLKLSGLDAGTYLGRLYRRNLVETYAETWSVTAAREAATRLRDWVADRRVDRVLLLGARVAAAVGCPVWERRTFTLVDGLEVTVAAIPHPSGRSHAYNDPAARDGARAAVLWVTGSL